MHRPQLFLYGVPVWYYRLCLVLGATLVTVSASYAQSPLMGSVNSETATPVAGVGHDYLHMLSETVDPSNGQVSVRVNVPTPTGRGLHLPTFFAYDSAGHRNLALDPSGTVLFQPPYRLYDDPDLHVSVPMATWNQWVFQPPKIVPIGSTDARYAGCNFATDFKFTDSRGTSHNLGLGSVWTGQWGGEPAGSGLRCQAGETNITYGSDGRVQASISQSPVAPATTSDLDLWGNNMHLWSVWGNGGLTSITGGVGPFTVMDAEGTRYHFNGASDGGGAPAPYEALPDQIEDRNGNLISSVSPLSPQGGTIVVGGMSYTLANSETTSSTGSYTPAYDQGFSEYATEQTKISQPLLRLSIPGGTGSVSTITLPNNQLYRFYYGVNNVDASIQNQFGLLNQIVYPDGGWVKYTWTLPLHQDGISADGTMLQNIGSFPVQSYTFSDVLLHMLDAASLIGCNSLSDDCVDHLVDPSFIGTGYQPGNIIANGEFIRYSVPVITQRQVSFDGTTVAQTQVLSYSTTWPTNWHANLGDWTSKDTTVTTKDAVTGQSFLTKYNYLPHLGPSIPLTDGTISSPVPLENTISYYDSSNTTTPIATVTKTWADIFDLGSEQTTLPNGSSTVTNYTWGAGGCTVNPPTLGPSFPAVLCKSNFTDYGQSAPSLFTAYTYTDWLGTSAPPQVQSKIIFAPLTVGSSSGLNGPVEGFNQVAEVDYSYDAFGLAEVSPTPTQHDPSVNTSVVGRGNLTSVTTKCFGCTDAKTTYTYDITGQRISMTDPCGNTACSDLSASSHVTKYSYTDNPGGNQNTNAYLTKVTRPTTNGITHTQSFSYNYTTGQIASSTDENNQTTSYVYNTPPSGCSYPDGLSRLSEEDLPDGGLTTYCYSDTVGAPSITSTRSMASTGAKSTSISVGNGLGMVTQTQISDPEGTVNVDSSYAGSGEVISVSNPYRSKTESTYGVTSYQYDPLGRKAIQVQPDGSQLQWCHNGVATGGQGNCLSNNSSVTSGAWVDYSDETGRHWQHLSDARGRLITAMETSPGSNVLSALTSYGYDNLNNLIVVNQLGQAGASSRVRRFSYDSLSRLLTSSNPETGTICYGQLNGTNCTNGYDANGNLAYKTDARGMQTSYMYDALNRLVSKTFLAASGTASSCYQYDTSSISGASGNLIGRLTNSWTQPAGASCTSPTDANVQSRHSILSYDALGRVSSEQQCARGTCGSTVTHPVAYSYDLAGNISSHTNGLGMTFFNCWDGANRLSLVATSAVPCTSPNSVPSAVLFSAPNYSPSGGLTGALLGTGLQLVRTYDNRLRVKSEADSGMLVPAAVPGSATLTIPGLEQTKP